MRVCVIKMCVVYKDVCVCVSVCVVYKDVCGIGFRNAHVNKKGKLSSARLAKYLMVNQSNNCIMP